MLDTRPWGPPRGSEEISQASRTGCCQDAFLKSTLNWGGPGGRQNYPHMLQDTSCDHLRNFSTVWSWRANASNLVTTRVTTVEVCSWTLLLM